MKERDNPHLALYIKASDTSEVFDQIKPTILHVGKFESAAQIVLDACRAVEANGRGFIEARWEFPAGDPTRYLSRTQIGLNDNPLYKDSLDSVEVGDIVIISSPGSSHLMKVEKTTKTQITVNGERYNRASGRLIRSGYFRAWASAPLHINFNRTEINRYRESKAVKALEKEKYPFAKFISELRMNDLKPMQIEALQQAAELLGYVASDTEA